MKVVGIVAEYNPFHNGHAYQIERLRDPDGEVRATHVVAVMSGHFVQRGEPAVLPKADRARLALLGGVDLVLELPAPWCLSSAEGFARGAVSLLHALSCVDAISFGSECGDLSRLQKAADLLDSPRGKELLQHHLGYGISYPEARQKAVRELGGDSTAALLSEPNNTLGIEYLRALRDLSSPIAPTTVRRLGPAHDAQLPLGTIASASHLRTLVRAGRLRDALPYLPAPVGKAVEQAVAAGRCPADPALLERAVLAHLRRLDRQALSRLPGVSEGLENRLYDAIRQASSLSDLLARLKTKRYPLTRLQRLVWCAFLGIGAEDAAGAPPYLRVLGATGRGFELLSRVKAAGGPVPLVSRASQLDALPGAGQRIWQLEAAAADLYALSLPVPLPCGTEHTAGMIKLE